MHLPRVRFEARGDRIEARQRLAERLDEFNRGDVDPGVVEQQIEDVVRFVPAVEEVLQRLRACFFEERQQRRRAARGE